MTTSEGIILIDSGYDYSAKELITDGLKKLKLDPAQIKYVILTHVHGDRFYGAPYLQKTYNARVIMSEADWNAMTKTNDPAELYGQHLVLHGHLSESQLFQALKHCAAQGTRLGVALRQLGLLPPEVVQQTLRGPNVNAVLFKVVG